MRVLVIDDEPALRQMLTLMLMRAGYEVEAAASAEEASARIAWLARVAGIARGLHIAAEKPLSLDQAGLDQIRDALRNMGLVIDFVGSVDEALEVLVISGAHQALQAVALDGRQADRPQPGALPAAPGQPPRVFVATSARTRSRFSSRTSNSSSSCTWRIIRLLSFSFLSLL